MLAVKLSSNEKAGSFNTQLIPLHNYWLVESKNDILYMQLLYKFLFFELVFSYTNINECAYSDSPNPLMFMTI